MYFVIPLLIPPVDNDNIIDAKLFNCPTKATPAGPIIDATTFTLISPVSILTKVDIEVREKTFTISVFSIFFSLVIILSSLINFSY